MQYQRRIRLMAGLLALGAAGLIAGLALSQTAQQIWNDNLGTLGGALTPAQLNRVSDYWRGKFREDLAQTQSHQAQMDALQDQLTLTNTQEDQLITIISTNLDQLTASGRPLFNDEKAMHAALLANPPDPAELQADAALAANDLGSAAVAASQVAHQARQVLTPAQNDALDGLLSLQSQIEQQNSDRQPNDTDQALATWKALDLRPVQVDRLFGLTRTWVRLADSWQSMHRASLDAQLAFILSPDQMRGLTDFRVKHDPEFKADRNEFVDQFLTLRDVNLTREQMDALTAVIENELPDFYLLVSAWTDGGQALRDEVMARDPDENAIRASAASLAGVINDSLTLEARIVQQARLILSEDQFNRIDRFTAYLENKARGEFDQTPDRFNDLTEFRARLGLSADQRQAVRKLMRDQRNDLQQQWSVIAGGGGGPFGENPGMY